MKWSPQILGCFVDAKTSHLIFHQPFVKKFFIFHGKLIKPRFIIYSKFALTTIGWKTCFILFPRGHIKSKTKNSLWFITVHNPCYTLHFLPISLSYLQGFQNLQLQHSCVSGLSSYLFAMSTETYSKPCQTSKMKHFTKTVNSV